ncbi:MAG: isoprenyl transferase [Deltaproteobacteria bacterium]|nr:isoprenyl transferase [Deltaproteobacteria bacterium]MBW2362424.1 isoprenyl transferase [Deltaproteobacteria bacterium]
MPASRLDPKAIPRHVAIIMDGNGRWAEERGMSRIEGHRQGLESVRAVVRAAHELGVQTLTLYAFSLENWNRPKREVDELMSLLEFYIDAELPEVQRNGIRVTSIGRLERLPISTRAKLEEAEAATRDNREMQLVFAVSYGGRAEIVDAARKLLRDAEVGKVDPEQLDEKSFAAYLYQPELSDPDLLIRTSGERRVSNFLLWQIAYTEIFVSDVRWPDFRKTHLVDAIVDYQARERRFGLTSEQVRS